MHYHPAQPDDLHELAELLVEAYHCDPQTIRDDLRHLGLEGFRLLRDGQRLAAALECVPVGQWFAARRVSCAAVAMVATALPARGCGAAVDLLKAALAEIRRRGLALSVLYPSTTALYRKVGYERAGTLVRYDLPLAGLRSGARQGELVAREVRWPEIKALYAACAARSSGLLDRDESFWQDRFDPLRGAPVTPYVVRFDDRAEGYALLARGNAERRLVLREVMFRTARAGERLLALLADHGTQFDTARWWGGLADPLSHLLPEQQAVGTLQNEWMLRIVDLPRALHERGYPPSVQAELDLELEDPLLPDNAGAWRLTVAAGQARVERGGQRRMWLDIRGLAALYTGHLDPSTLEILNLVRGPAEDLAQLATLFAGPKPYMSDVF